VKSQEENFAAQYAEYSDGELLRLASEGGLREEAQLALRQELRKRQITSREVRQEKLHRKRSELQRNVGSNPYDAFRGIGLTFRGAKYLLSEGEHKIAVKTRWLVISWMSIVPLGSYRIKVG
jgi:hypothetical protein